MIIYEYKDKYTQYKINDNKSIYNVEITLKDTGLQITETFDNLLEAKEYLRAEHNLIIV